MRVIPPTFTPRPPPPPSVHTVCATRYFTFWVALAHTGVAIWTPFHHVDDFYYEIVLNCLLFLMVVEMSFKVIGYPMLHYWKHFSKFDLLIIVASVITEFILPIVGKDMRAITVHSAGRTTQALRCLRVLTMSKRLRQLCSSVISVRHVILRFMIVFLLLVYSFAAVAVIIFEGNLPDGFDPTPNDDVLDNIDARVVMNTLSQAMFCLFQVRQSRKRYPERAKRPAKRAISPLAAHSSKF